jgi:hypothetical protein
MSASIDTRSTRKKWYTLKLLITKINQETSLMTTFVTVYYIVCQVGWRRSTFEWAQQERSKLLGTKSWAEQGNQLRKVLCTTRYWAQQSEHGMVLRTARRGQQGIDHSKVSSEHSNVLRTRQGNDHCKLLYTSKWAQQVTEHSKVQQGAQQGTEHSKVQQGAQQGTEHG